MACKNETSKGVLCATIGVFPRKSNNLSTISLSLGALETISLVIPVISAIISDIGINGLIKVAYLSDGFPFLNRIAATSIGRSVST